MASPSPFPVPPQAPEPFSPFSVFNDGTPDARRSSSAFVSYAPSPSPFQQFDMYPATPQQDAQTPFAAVEDRMNLSSNSNFNSPFPAPLLSSAGTTRLAAPEAKAFSVTVHISDRYLNRMQWYLLTLGFSNPDGSPAFDGKRIRFDEHSIFFDARRKAVEDDDPPGPGDLVTVAFHGLCAEDKRAVIKCDKCRKKDQGLIMSKRKDDGKKKWFDDDEVNNTRLLQVVPPANSEDRIKIDGTITVKARISCCVGAVKQHHSNHATLDGNTDDPIIHKGCPGLMIKAVVTNSEFPEPAVGYSNVYHIVGKVSKKEEAEEYPPPQPPVFSGTKKGTKRSRGQMESEMTIKDERDNHSSLESEHEELASKRLAEMAAHSPKPPMSFMAPVPQSPSTWPSTPFGAFTSPSPMAVENYPNYISGPPTPMAAPPPAAPPSMTVVPSFFQVENDNSTALILHKIFRNRGHSDPVTALSNLAQRYKKMFDTIFPTPFREIYDPNFFSAENLRKIPAESPTMLCIYSIIGCITCGMSIDMADDIWTSALKLVSKYSKVDSKMRRHDILVIADTFNRIATYFGAIGALERARSYVTTAIEALAMLPEDLKDGKDGTCKPVYESLLWTKSTYLTDFKQLRESFEWAKECGRTNAQIYTLFSLTVSLCYPDIKRDPNELTFKSVETALHHTQTAPLLSVVRQLKELLIGAGYASVKDGRHPYQPLFDASFGALECWINGDLVGASAKIAASILPSALLTVPQIEAYIPLYFAAFVALQLAKFNTNEMLDYAELHLKQLMKINIMRWARNFLDHLIRRLDSLTDESSGLSWSELTRENCAQLGLCGPNTTAASVDSPAPTSNLLR